MNILNRINKNLYFMYLYPKTKHIHHGKPTIGMERDLA